MEDIISPPFGGSINGALVPQGVALGFFISPPTILPYGTPVIITGESQ